VERIGGRLRSDGELNRTGGQWRTETKGQGEVWRDKQGQDGVDSEMGRNTGGSDCTGNVL